MKAKKVVKAWTQSKKARDMMAESQRLRKNRGAGHTGPKMSPHPVMCIELKRRFPTVSSAAKWVRHSATAIVRVCGKVEHDYEPGHCMLTCGGYHWRYTR